MCLGNQGASHFTDRLPSHFFPNILSPTTIDMVMDTIREAPFGQLLRFFTRNHVLLYPEERDPNLWYSYIVTDESPSTPAVFEGKNTPTATIDVAQPPSAGTATGISQDHIDDILPEETDIPRHPFSGQESGNTLTTQHISLDHGRSTVGAKIDLEKDVIFIGWADNDPQVCLLPVAHHILQPPDLLMLANIV